MRNGWNVSLRTLNSAEKGIIDYSFTKLSLGRGQVFIRAFLEADSFRPYP
jgi:hypothetical protein